MYKDEMWNFNNSSNTIVAYALFLLFRINRTPCINLTSTATSVKPSGDRTTINDDENWL